VACCDCNLNHHYLFGNMEQFKAAHKLRRIQQLRGLLNNKKDEVHRDVLHLLRFDLHDLDILPEDLA